MKLYLIPTFFFALATFSLSETEPKNFSDLDPCYKPFSIHLEEPIKLRNFIERIKEEELKGEILNVIISPDAENVVIPVINLRNVSLFGILIALEPICGFDFSYDPGEREASVDGILTIGTRSSSKLEPVEKIAAFPNSVELSPALTTRAFSVKKLNARDVLILRNLIVNAWEQKAGSRKTPEESSSSVAYEHNAGIVIVRATPQDMAIAESFVLAQSKSVAERENWKEDVYTKLTDAKTRLLNKTESGYAKQHPEIMLLKKEVRRYELMLEEAERN